MRFVVEREKELQTFVPTPFWTLRTKVDVNGRIVEAAYEVDRIGVKADGESIVKECSGKTGAVEKLESTHIRTLSAYPIRPLNLTIRGLQALRLHTALALSVAERLYLDQLISYPRTSSQKLPPLNRIRRGHERA